MVTIMNVNCNKYKANEIIKFMRECTEKTQTEFAKDVNKKRGWADKAERAIIRIYLNDFLELAKKNNIEIIMKQNKKN